MSRLEQNVMGTPVNQSLTEYAYDEYGNQNSWVHKSWDAGAWVNTTSFTFVYDEDGNLLSYFYHTYVDGTGWVILAGSFYTYNANGNELTDLTQIRENDVWVNAELRTSVFDANYNCTSVVRQEWLDDSWLNITKVEYYFSPFKVRTICFEWIDGGWTSEDVIGGTKVVLNGDVIFWRSGRGYELYYSELYTNIKDNINSNLSVKCYPNPSHGLFYIEIPNEFNSDLKIELFDQNGHKVKSWPQGFGAVSQVLSVNVEGLPDGFYFLRLSSGKQIATQNILLVH
jgi:Secretion system C-terminal sorting domain